MTKPSDSLFQFAARFLPGLPVPDMSFSGSPYTPVQFLSRAIAGTVSLVLNHLIALQPLCQKRLQKEAGKRVLVSVAPVQLELQVTEQGFFQVDLNTGDSDRRAVDTHISMRWSDLAGSVGPPSSISRKAKVEGDMDFAQAISAVINDLSWDPERDLVKIIGDAQAVWVMNALSATGTSLKDVFTRFQNNLREYVVHEKSMTPTAGEFDEFCSDVNALRDELARLEKRIRTLGGHPMPGSST